jgi:phosphatidylglycerol---prolipoprotein diacylglyceryl transferase
MNSAFYINVDPVIIRLGPLTIGWYGLMVALGVVAVVSWLAWENKRTQRLSYDIVYTAALVGIPSGIVFSKILHVIDQWGYYSQHPDRIISGEGLTIWGAVLGATIGIWLYSLISRHFRFTTLADMIAPGIILAQSIGRVGCTFNGCCYGLESNLPIAIIYTSPNSYGPIGIPVLPTQTFEIFYDLLVFGVLLSLRGKLKPEGALFAVYYALYAVWRFGIDFIREGSPFLFGLHQAQVIALIVLIITVPVIVFKVRWDNEGEMVKAEGQSSLIINKR